MKPSSINTVTLVAVVVLGSLNSGCNAQTSAPNTNTPPPASVQNDATAGDQIAGGEASEAPAVTPNLILTNAPAVAEAPNPPEIPFGVDRPLPSTIPEGSPLAEVVKLGQAGVDPEVIDAFIRNSSSGFELGSEEIIFLSDIGMPNSVVAAMMERNEQLRLTDTTPLPVDQPTNEPPAMAATAPEEVPVEGPPQEEVSEDYFYDALSPYGSWIYVEGYGRCWQPSVVVHQPTWQPYCDRGRWAYTDYGWYWLSDYSWGWIPFHYGRWFNHSRWGWCWWPDTTWAPAWVTWRYDNSYCGWAPLPPRSYYTASGFTYWGTSVGFGFSFGLSSYCYTFVPWGRFCNYYPRNYCLSWKDANRICRKSAVCNKFAVVNNTIVNEGVPIQRVRASTRGEVRRYTVREAEGRVRREGLTSDGRTLLTRRPQAVSTAATTGNTRRETVSTRTSTPTQASAPTRVTPSASASPGIVRPGGNTPELNLPRRVQVNSTTPRTSSRAPERPTTSRIVSGNSSSSSASGPRVTTPTPTPPTQPVQLTDPIRRSNPRSSIAVIGGNQATRSRSQPYTVWSSPAARERETVSQRNSSPPQASTWQNPDPSPAIEAPQSVYVPATRNEASTRSQRTWSAPTVSRQPRSSGSEFNSRGQVRQPSTWSAPATPRYSAPRQASPPPAAPSYSAPRQASPPPAAVRSSPSTWSSGSARAESRGSRNR